MQANWTFWQNKSFKTEKVKKYSIFHLDFANNQYKESHMIGGGFSVRRESSVNSYNKLK